MRINSFILFFLLLGGLLCGSCGKKKAKEAEIENSNVGRMEHTMEINPVDTVRLLRRTFDKELISNGKLRAVTKGVLRFRESGVLRKIYVKNGSPVRQGDRIAELDPLQAEIQLKQAQLNMEKAEFDLADVLIGYGYNVKDTIGIPEQTMKVALMKSGYKSTAYDLQKAQEALANTVLYAPFSGKVANLKTKVYEQTPDEFCTLINDDLFEVDFNILETEKDFVQEGQCVRVASFSRPDDMYDGVVTEINPIVSDKGQINIKAQIKGAKGLIDGMNVRVYVKSSAPNQLVVPKSAVVIRDGYEVLFRYGPDGKAMWTYVTVLMANSREYAVTANNEKSAELSVGDVVVVSGNLNLADGSELVIKK